ncbi:hypothetical protein ABZ935_16815 [Streptomyces coeruleorubidus]|uniref:hypothetical protein n=1 Tax=Streptomyces coeruleorubidus TaxID=116188 RepID=UPI0033DC39C4
MPFWSATIPTRTPHGGSGVHVFIVDADHSEDARRHALARADLPDARRHRRNAALDIQALTVTEILPSWRTWKLR